MQDEYQKIRDYFVEFIDSFRKEFGDEPKIRDGKRNFATEFSEPCQLSILWMRRDDQHDYQIAMKTKNPKMPDNEISVFGPFSLKQQETVASLEKLLSDEFFRFVEHRSEIDKYRKSVESYITKGYETVKTTKIGGGSQSSLLHKKDYISIYYGLIYQYDLKKIIERIRSDLSHDFPIFKKPKYHDYYGGFIRPPVWIGKIPEQNYQDKLQGKWMVEHLGEPLEFTYKDRKIILKRDGYLAISVNKASRETEHNPFSLDGIEERTLVLSELNEFLGMFLLQGINVFSTSSNSKNSCRSLQFLL